MTTATVPVSQKSIDQLSELLGYLWNEEYQVIREKYESADEALAAWDADRESFGLVGYIIQINEELFNVDPVALITELF